MKHIDEFDDLYRLVIKKLQILADNGDYKSLSSSVLCQIKEEIDKMNEIRNPQLFKPYYPRYLLDLCDYSDPLMISLMQIADIYSKMNH